MPGKETEVKDRKKILLRMKQADRRNLYDKNISGYFSNIDYRPLKNYIRSIFGVIFCIYARHISVMQNNNDKDKRFLEVLDRHKSVIAKVCCIYSSPSVDFDDLYQETVINLWNGFDKFRGDAKISTWIYRAAINTCITWNRRNKKHANNISLEPDMPVTTDDDSGKLADYKQLQYLISKLNPIEKAIITLWLDEKSYEEIASITGISHANVAVKLHRIKEKMSKMSEL